MSYHENKDFEGEVEAIVAREGDVMGDSQENIPRIDNWGVGVIDPNQKRQLARNVVDFLLRKPKKEVYAHIASLLQHPDGRISATVFGRDNLGKVHSLANKVAQALNVRTPIEVEVALESTKYGSDTLVD